jgi:hypothetical protein
MNFLDTIGGIISRRVLLNYRIDPNVLRSVLPKPFKPKLYNGYGVGGVCMIRFKTLRPKGFPMCFGFSSENAAHRIAVEWEGDSGQHCEGVFIPRRDTNLWFNKILGGRVFPGIFNKSTFLVSERDDEVGVRIIRSDGGEEVSFLGRVAKDLPSSSIFPNLEEAAKFFSLGATGYSATRNKDHFHGMDLKCLTWSIEPLEVLHAKSCFFGNKSLFPNGSVTLDCALLMRDIDHEWHSRPDLYVSEDQKRLTSTCSC